MITKRVCVEPTAPQSTSPCHMDTSIPGTFVPAATARGAGTTVRIAVISVAAQTPPVRARRRPADARRRTTPVIPIGTTLAAGCDEPGIRLDGMLGEEEAVVLEAKAFDLHGVTYYDLVVGFPDRSVQQARLGAESVPDDLKKGERILATRVANMVISVRRP
jgi:hypothetical protein